MASSNLLRKSDKMLSKPLILSLFVYLFNTIKLEHSFKILFKCPVNLINLNTIFSHTEMSIMITDDKTDFNFSK